MWYANGKSNISQLSSLQSDILLRVSRKEIQLRALYSQSGDVASSIVGVYNFYDVNGSVSDDMAFYYPTYKESNYSSLNYAIDQTVYQSLITNQQATNNSYMMLGGTSRQGIAQNIFSLCKLRNGTNAIGGFTCIDFDTAKFNELALATIGSNNFIVANYYLIAPAIYGGNNVTIIDNITKGNITPINQEQ